jgi:CheY-like chemotaxis protein
MVVRMLPQAGFEPIEVANGAEALALLQRGLSPSVIVLDLWMPIMDGWEFLARPTQGPGSWFQASAWR